MDKLAFLKELATRRLALQTTLDTVLAQLPEPGVEQPGIVGEMSMQAVLAHILWYEKEMIGVLEQRALVGSDWWELPTAQRNARILAEFGREHSAADLRRESDQDYARLLELLEALPDAAFEDAGYFREMPPDWLPWQVLDSNLGEHYADHTADLRAWLARRQG